MEISSHNQIHTLENEKTMDKLIKPSVSKTINNTAPLKN